MTFKKTQPPKQGDFALYELWNSYNNIFQLFNPFPITGCTSIVSSNDPINLALICDYKDYLSPDVTKIKELWKTSLTNLINQINKEKLPKKGEASYKGNLETLAFNLGKFTNNADLGAIDFKGSIEGSSFNLEKLKTSQNFIPTEEARDKSFFKRMRDMFS